MSARTLARKSVKKLLPLGAMYNNNNNNNNNNSNNISNNNINNNNNYYNVNPFMYK